MKTQELRDDWIDATEEHITEQAVTSSSAKVLPENTVLIAMYGATVGQLGLLRTSMTCNQACCALIVDPRQAHFRYVFYQLLHARTQLKSLATGAAQQNLSGALIKSLRLPFPSLLEQRAIAHILGTLDDKIELNRRTNETLEAMARALFKSWFVDFDPVRAKAEGRDPGLPPHLADLFPDSFDDSELGDIPLGWDVRHFGEQVSLLRDQVNPLESPTALFKYFSIPAFDDSRRASTVFGEDIKSLKFHVPPGTVLLSKLNPAIERVWLVDVKPDEYSVCSTEFLVLRAEAPITRAYVYCQLSSPPFRLSIGALVTGTSNSHQRAQASQILAIDTVAPASSIIAAFDHVVAPLLARAFVSRREADTMSAVRDALLPRLISGDLRVKDPARFLCEIPA